MSRLPGNWSNSTLGSATVAFNTGGVFLTAPAVGSSTEQWRYVYWPLSPTSGYTVTFRIDWSLMPGGENAGGMLLTDGTKLLTWGPQFQGNTAAVCVIEWNSATNYNSAPYSQTGSVGAVWSTAKYWQIVDDGTSLKFGLSLNDGQDWIYPYSMPRTAFLTPTSIGFGIDTNGSGYTSYGRLDWIDGTTTSP